MHRFSKSFSVSKMGPLNRTKAECRNRVPEVLKECLSIRRTEMGAAKSGRPVSTKARNVVPTKAARRASPPLIDAVVALLRPRAVMKWA